MKFVYPLKGDNYDEKQTKARFGNFPISSFNTWHGGIHLEGAKKPLVAITNGRIIAYKIPDNYTDVCVDDITQQYSNGYILIQHDYKSTEGQELRFYSLYHHILPVSEMGDTTPFPSFVGKTTAIINKKEGWPVEGLNARISNGTAVDTTCTVKLIIPKGATVTLDPSENDSNLRLGKYVRVTYTDKNNITYDDIYIYKGISQVKELTSNTLEIITSEDKNEDKTVLGARVRKEGKGSADIIKIIPFEEEIIIDPNNKDSDKWVKLADNSGYIFKTSIKTTTVFDESKAKKNTVFACDIPVKAGELIGYVGKFGFTKYPSYDTCHFEIFTDASAAKVQDFLSNKKKDGKEDKTYYKLASGAELKPNLESSLTIPKNNRLKCLQIKGDYVKIKIIAQSEIVLRTDLDGHGKKSVLGKLKYQYTIKKDKVATINAIFGHSFDTTTKLYFGANVTSDSKKRKVLYIPDLCNKIYWVHKDNFSGTYKKNDEGYSDNGINTIFLDVPVTSKENPITVEKAIPKIKVLKTKSDAEKQLWLQISCTYEKESKKIKKQGWISQKDSKLEQINPFNWVDFDFHLLDAGNQYVYEVEGFNKLENTCDFVTEVWNILDDNEDKVINHQELQRAYRSDIKLEKLSKLICTHKNEWSYDAATIRSEAEQYFDIGINEEEDLEKKQQLENKKCALLDALETKMTQLMWWQEVQSAVYTPPPAPAPKPDNQLVKNDNSQALIAKKQEEQQVEAPQASLASGSATKTTPTQELTQVSHQDTSTLEAESKNTTVTPATTVSKKEEKSLPERAVPSTDIVHHFHPIGFIRQMRLMFPQGTGECFCNKDFTAEDLRAMVKRIRDNTFDKTSKESITFHHKERLFNIKGGVPESDRNFEKFAEVLNTSFRKYGITNCIHKIHYLANMYVETMYFTATEELESKYTNKYKPYIGRGFMHLTHDYHYKEYSDIAGNTDIKTGTNYLKVGSDLNIAADTAGWYWKKSKLNALSETDDILKTTKKINGGTHGYKDRRIAWIKLKEIFNYPYGCVTDASKHEAPVYGEGVLEEMRKWADEHVQYKQEGEWTLDGTKRTGLRTKQTEDALGRLDCSEFVCRYLHKLGVTSSIKSISTEGMLTEEEFKKNLGNNNIEHVANSEKADFIPQAGDVFVWRNRKGGHTGIVHSVDGDKITILEAIGSGGSSDEEFNNNNGGYEGKNSTRTSVYQRTGGALAGHSGWKGYFRPKNYTKKL